MFFCLKGLGKIWKMSSLLCACAVVTTLETQKCWKKAPRFATFNFFTNRIRQKRFSQNERTGADLLNGASKLLILVWGLSCDLSKLSHDFALFFDFERPELSPWAKIEKSKAFLFAARTCWKSVPNFMEIEWKKSIPAWNVWEKTIPKLFSVLYSGKWALTFSPNFMDPLEIVQGVKKLNSISRERLNFRRGPILCTTLYRNPMQASHFVGTFYQLFLWFFKRFSQKMPLYLFLYHGAKNSKMTKTQNKGSCFFTRQLTDTQCDWSLELE